jgi:hypothetical protein
MENKACGREKAGLTSDRRDEYQIMSIFDYYSRK